MLEAFRIIAERRIKEAIDNGELICESWRGKPLPLEDDRELPPELRMAYKILKNADCLPPELALKKDIARLEDLLDKTTDEHTRVRQLKKLNFLVLKLNTMRTRPVLFEEQERYFGKIAQRTSVQQEGDDNGC